MDDYTKLKSGVSLLEDMRNLIIISDIRALGGDQVVTSCFLGYYSEVSQNI